MEYISKILAPTDCSEPSIDASKYAIETAKRFQATLTVLHVVSFPESIIRSVMPQQKNINLDLDSMAKMRLFEYWNAIAGSYGEAKLVIASGDPFTEIIKTSKTRASDIIIMGTHGRTGLMNIVMGSVAEKVVRYSPFPVLTVKHKGYKYFPKPDYEYDTHPTY